jgi:hypothetical protein
LEAVNCSLPNTLFVVVAFSVHPWCPHSWPLTHQSHRGTRRVCCTRVKTPQVDRPNHYNHVLILFSVFTILSHSICNMQSNISPEFRFPNSDTIPLSNTNNMKQSMANS